jgi:hypothetical protein
MEGLFVPKLTDGTTVIIWTDVSTYYLHVMADGLWIKSEGETTFFKKHTKVLLKGSLWSGILEQDWLLVDHAVEFVDVAAKRTITTSKVKCLAVRKEYTNAVAL